MIRGTHGFDVCDGAGAMLGFDVTAYGDLFGNALIVDGAPGTGSGSALFEWYDSFGNPTLTRVFDDQSFWCVGLNAKQSYINTGTGPAAQSRFLLIGDGTAPMIGLQFEADGTMSVQDLVHNLQVARTTATFSVNQWPGYIELRCSGFNGVSGVTCELWVNDVLKCSGVAGINSRYADRISLYQSGPGIVFDDVYMLDGQGVAPWNDRLGPIRITTTLPASNASGAWSAFPSTDEAYQAISESHAVFPYTAPDGDTSYVFPNGLGQNEMFIVAPMPCYGLVLGIMVNICFRGTSGAAGLEALFVEGSGVYNLGVLNVSGGYHTAQAFAALSPATAQYFNDAEIAGNLWGFLTNTSLDLRVTQLYLEKVVSLRSSPYGCGKQSYSF